MGLYAQNTVVPVERAQAEIKRELVRYGAESFTIGEELKRAMVQFLIHKRSVRFVIDLPNRDEDRFLYTDRRNLRRSDADARKEWDKACRSRWRALYLFCKAALEAVHEGIADFDEVFLPYLVLPNGQTVGGHMKPLIHRAISNGVMPRLSIPGPKGDDVVAIVEETQ